MPFSSITARRRLRPSCWAWIVAVLARTGSIAGSHQIFCLRSAQTYVFVALPRFRFLRAGALPDSIGQEPGLAPWNRRPTQPATRAAQCPNSTNRRSGYIRGDHRCIWPAFGGQIQFGCSRVGDMPLVLRLLPALVIVSIVGLIDDIFSLRPWIKLTAEAVAAALAWFGGIQVSVNLGSDFVPNGQP